jgi:hypothetical protein
MCGEFYYSTVLNNTIYAFATQSNFKYNGKRWEEVAKCDIINQKGFSPFKISYIDAIQVLRSNMCYTYDNSVYMFIPFKNDDKNSKSYLLKYTDNGDSSWENLDLSAQQGTTVYQNLDIYNFSENIYNNIVTVVVNNKVYIFGGVFYDNKGKPTTNNYSVGIYDLIANKFEITYYSSDKFIFSSFSKAFVSLYDSNIYLVGVKNTGDTTNKIYKYFIDKNTFSLVGNCFPTDYANKTDFNFPNTGGFISYYYYNSDNETDYISIMSDIDTTDVRKIISRIKIPNTDNKNPITPEIKSIYTPTNSDINNIQSSYIKVLFKLSEYLYYGDDDYRLKVSCYFEINNFMFIINRYGDIFRCNNYKDDDTTHMNICPCYGISDYETPKYNTLVCNTTPSTCQPGYKWSDLLCACYKLNFQNISNKCYESIGGFQCGGTCIAKNTCEQDNKGDKDKDNPYKWRLNQFGHCVKSHPSCGFNCILDTVPKDYFYCDKQTKKWTKCDIEDGCNVNQSWDSTGKGESRGGGSCDKGVSSDCPCLTSTPSQVNNQCIEPAY